MAFWASVAIGLVPLLIGFGFRAGRPLAERRLYWRRPESFDLSAYSHNLLLIHVERSTLPAAHNNSCAKSPVCLHRRNSDRAITGATAATCFDIHRQQSLEDCSGLVQRYASGATDFLIGR